MGNFLDELDYVHICDSCDTIATVIHEGNTITITPCLCITKENNK
jgi:hypothetical protein